MNRYKTGLLWLGFGILVLVSFACELSNINFDDSVTDYAEKYDVSRDDSVFFVSGQPQTMDPALSLSGGYGPVGHVFSGLVTLDPNLEVQPDLAAGWQVSPDGLVYTFYLRKNAVFHDGRSVTADDVLFSWERAANPATESDTVLTYLGDVDGVAEVKSGAAEHIRGLQVIDPYTFQVTLKAPSVYFLAKLSYPVAFVVDSVNVSEDDWEHAPNGTGPFKLDKWTDDEVMILSRNERYYLVPAKVKHVVLLMGAGLPMAMYENGQIDMVGVGGDTLERVEDPNSAFAAQLQTAVNMCTNTVGLNTQQRPFNDERVRQAFNYALNRQQLVNTFYNGDGFAAVGALPPGMPGFLASRQGYPFDVAKAKALLVEAGYTNMEKFPVLKFYTSGYGTAGTYETALITMWQENLGVTIEPVVLDPYEYFAELYKGNTGDIFSLGWCADYPDPQNFLDILYHSGSDQNYGHFADATVDSLLEKARSEADPAKRLSLYQQAEDVVVQKAPVVFLDYSLTAVLVSPRLQGYKLTAMGVPQWQYLSLTTEEK